MHAGVAPDVKLMEKSPVFEKIYRDYLSQVALLDLNQCAGILGASLSGAGVMIPFLGKRFWVTSDGISDEHGGRPVHAVNVVLCNYLILCPPSSPGNGTEWVSYKDFKDAAPFVGGFVNNTEKPIARNFSGRIDALRLACESLGGCSLSDPLTYDLAMRVEALPRVPLFMLFNDADEEFPAQCRVLFERRASVYLDMECLAIIGWLFSDYLMQVHEASYQTLM